MQGSQDAFSMLLTQLKNKTKHARYCRNLQKTGSPNRMLWYALKLATVFPLKVKVNLPAFTSHLVGNQSHFLGWQTPSRADCVLCHRRPIHALARLQKSMGTQGTSGRTDEWRFFGRESLLSLAGTGHDTKQSMICIRDYGPAFPTCMNTSCHVMLCRISAVHILKSMQSRSFIGFRQEHLCCTCSAPCPHIVAT